MLKLTRKKRSRRCSAISWQDFEGHFTIGLRPSKSCQEMALHRWERFLRVSFSMFLIFLQFFLPHIRNQHHRPYSKSIFKRSVSRAFKVHKENQNILRKPPSLHANIPLFTLSAISV